MKNHEIFEMSEKWKFYIWLAITGSNIYLGPKIISPIASTRREQAAGPFREALRRFVWKRQGGSHQPPSSLGEGGETPYPARVKQGYVKHLDVYLHYFEYNDRWGVQKP